MPVQPVALITDPLAVFMFLLTMVAAVFYVSEFPALKRFFHYIPPLVFCYFLPMFSTTLGITPEANPLYDWFNMVFLPPILLLLLLSADVSAILRLGPKAVGVMLAGTVGIVGGAVLGYAMFRGHLDPEGWKNIGALSASWTGGSANMFAVKSALAIPDSVFSPMIIVDSVFCYSWMGLLIFLAPWQDAYARRFRTDEAVLHEVKAKLDGYSDGGQRAATTRDLLVVLGVAMVGGYLCLKAGQQANAALKPSMESHPFLKTFSAMTITVMLVTAAGLALSFTPLRRLEQVGASRMGYAMLYLLLPTFGAQANLREIGQTPWYAAVAVVMLAVHAVCLFIAMRLARVPLFFGATGSQANVGGPASASVVASAYQPVMAPFGVLLGVLGGILGTYAGLLAAMLCGLLAQ